MMDYSYHRPVMLDECMEGLALKPGGIYIDLTFGGGGHTKEILRQLHGKGKGSVFGFDQDDDARSNAELIEDSSFTFVQANFRYFAKYLKLYKVSKVDGILADLGVSSHQIDEPERGFSTRFEGPLDMRMDRSKGHTAAEILNESSAEELQKIFGMYGEVRNAKTLAGAIVSARVNKPFEDTGAFVAFLKSFAPRGKDFKYYAQVFQALRIAVNDEMAALEEMLLQCGDVLNEGGRLVVMSYHSLEDRLVKNYINYGNVEGNPEKDFYGNLLRPIKPINKKPIEASEEETKLNNRARSAKLRIGERL
ncbi:16S rRNA (cytosine(1402)-N(4))-methyltransferase RsmH [Peijinzhouia sedimentorum]